LCGRLSIEIDGVQLADRLRGRQVRMLLAYLVLNRARYVARDELVEALWPRSGRSSHDAALRTLLSRLRSAVGSAAVVGRDELILGLPEPVWVDFEAAASELARAQQALERADPRAAWALAQVPLNIASRGLLPGAQAGWLEPPRQSLEDIRLQALEVIGAAGLRMGMAQLASVERSARALIEAEPYRESGYVLLMDALAMRGNVAEGLRVFERLRALLREELGTTPSPEALTAHERLLRPQGGVSAPAAPGQAPAAPIAVPAELRDRAQSPLVGRRREMSELARLWEGARAGRLHELAAGEEHGPQPRQIVVLSGDAGIGKTSLAAELARRAHEDGGVVMAGRAQEEGLAPYQPFLESLSHYFAVSPDEALVPAVREYGPELAPLIPELRRRLPELATSPPGEPESERYRLFEAFVGLLSAIADQAPILLVLDDLHWADRPTLLLLRHLARAREPARLLILVAYRTEATGAPLLEALTDLRRERLVTALEIGGLSERETAELVRQRMGEAPSRAFARAVHAETEGNPFFIEEIARNLVTAGVRAGAASASELQRFALPEGVKQVIAHRLSHLEPKTVECLRVAAVLGREFDLALLEQLVGFEEEEFLRALEEALAAGVLLEADTPPGRYSFSHALIRDALYEGMSAPRRARIHRRVGQTLEELPEPALGMLALHFTRAAGADDAERAIAYATRAGAQASAALAHEEAAQHYAQALEVLLRFHPDRDALRLELLLELGEALVRAGERPRAAPVFRDAAALARQLADRPAFVRAAVDATRRYVQQPGVVEARVIEMLEAALEMTSGEVSLERIRLLGCLCSALYFSPDSVRMEELSAEAMRIGDELDDPLAKAYALAARRRALWNPARLSERLVASTDMLTLARQVEDLELELQAHAWLVVDLLESGELGAVDAQIQAFTAGAERLREPLYEWHVGLWRAMRALLAGLLVHAEELARDALAAGGPGEDVTAPQYFAIQLLAIRREQRRMAEIEDTAREAARADPLQPAWGVVLAILLIESERIEEARVEFDRLAARRFDDITQNGDWPVTVSLLAEVCADLDDRDRAALLYERLLPYSGRTVVAGFGAVCLGSIDRQLGRLAGVLGWGEKSRVHLERALEVDTRLRAPVWIAHDQLELAHAVGAGLRASRMIEDARRAADTLGLARVSARAAALRHR
jgi:DNA-binding SARP family transcriptional activator